MATHKIHTEVNESYFVTFTCHKWLNLFQEADIYSYFNKWFEYLLAEHAKILAYVIMPNHFHGIIHLREGCVKSLNQLVSNGKRFLAYEIVSRLNAIENKDLLNIMQQGVSDLERTKGKKHQVFTPSFDAKQCFDIKMLERKIQYIHENPVLKKWNLVEDWSIYAYSSASFYELGIENQFVTHYKDIS